MALAAAKSSGIRNDVLLPDAVRDYVAEHKLEKVVTSALNLVIAQMPEDPYARLAEELSKSSTAAPRFVTLRPDAAAPRSLLRFHVVVASRGVNIRIHRLDLTEALQKDDRREKWVGFLQEFFAQSFGSLHVDGFLEIHERCTMKDPPQEVDQEVVTLALTNQLLEAAAAAMNLDVLGFLQHVLQKVGCEASPPLVTRGDLQLWRERWPRLAAPIFHGGAASGCCAPLKLAVALPAQAAAGADPEDLRGWLPRVTEALKAVKAEAVRGLQADKTTASLVVEGTAHALPAGIAATVQALRKAAEAVGEPAKGASGVLMAYADEAWREEEQAYELEAGKAKTLEELVDFYAELTEDGWIATLVNPFRSADAQAGCELLKAQRPELKLLSDFGAEIPEPAEDVAFGCFWRPPCGSLPLTLRQFAEQSGWWEEGWQAAALEAPSAQKAPALLEALMACSVQLLYVPEELPAELLEQLSSRQDELLQRVLLTSSEAPEAPETAEAFPAEAEAE